MTSRTHRTFRRDFARLPTQIQRRARLANKRFVADPNHPGLEFKPVNTTQPLWSVRVSDSYRAAGVRTGETIIWYFVGTHAEYDQLLARYA